MLWFHFTCGSGRKTCEPGRKGMIVELQVSNPCYCATSIAVSSLMLIPIWEKFPSKKHESNKKITVFTQGQ